MMTQSRGPDVRARILADRLRLTNVPLGLREWTFATFPRHAGSAAALRLAKEYASGKGPLGFVLVGPTGTGKTSLAVSILRAWVEGETTEASHDYCKRTAQDWSWAFAETDANRAREQATRRRPAPAWFDTWIDLRTALRAAKDDEAELQRELQRDVRLLVLDDLAIGELTPWREGVLSALFGRVENGRRLVLTSNRTLDQLVPYIGDRATDRLRDTARFRVVELTGRSRRETGGAV